MKKSFFVWLAIVLMMTACGNDGGGNDGGGNYTPSVYVVGNVINEGGSGTNPCYWKDGVRTDLDTTGTLIATGIAVSKGNVYVIGYDNSSNGYMWVNGVKQPLSGIQYPSAIKVVGNTVYIAGSTGDDKACVWINDTVSTVDTEKSGANGIAVTDDTIYLVGGTNDQGTGYAYVWTRPISEDAWTEKQIENSSSSEAYGIAVNNGTFYVAGYIIDDGKQKPCLWSGNSLGSLNKTDLPIPDEYTDDPYGQAYSILYYNGQTYIAGHYNIALNDTYYSRAALWIGTNEPVLYAPEDGSDSAAFSVFVYNGDVYVAGGYEKPRSDNNSQVFVQPCYWKNGTRVDLEAPEGTDDVTSIVGQNAIAIVVQ